MPTPERIERKVASVRFLLGALKHFVADARDRERAQKRGGGIVPEQFDEKAISEVEAQVGRATRWTADHVYEREWAASLLRQALERLAQECALAGKARTLRLLEAISFGDGRGRRSLRRNGAAAASARRDFTQRRGTIARTLSCDPARRSSRHRR